MRIFLRNQPPKKLKQTQQMGIESALFLLLVAFGMSHESVAQSAGCTTALISLSPCLTYITGSGGSSTSTAPSSSCCSRLATVVQSQPQCLCSALNGGAAVSLGVTINRTRALGLPAACSVQTPPPSRCDDANGAAAAPAISPISSPGSSPSDDEELGEAPTTRETTFPSEVDSKYAPNNRRNPESGGRSLIKTPFYDLTVVGLLLTALL
ncbi:non-specific lipid-transfer protein-like protein At2g13820 [Cucurbita pepo subsp. pepo]|uniref:non-specific lipid-transfer protein-like protein At2g13820 n=1 Tax=Cucurbita pepo subsp. pepo TaxID=3664 RepID=UPI000C9D274C|nr:non-specific lipid-transfer protein-like protein At2g13820 [Cucurbita pepo subsp. pepo]